MLTAIAAGHAGYGKVSLCHNAGLNPVLFLVGVLSVVLFGLAADC